MDPKTAAPETEYQGQTVYFCVPGCKVASEKDLEKYLAGATSGKKHQHHHGN